MELFNNMLVTHTKPHLRAAKADEQLWQDVLKLILLNRLGQKQNSVVQFDWYGCDHTD